MFTTTANALVQRLRESRPLYLITLCLHMDARISDDWDRRFPTPCPRAYAVCDDFGDLVLVSGWY